MAADPIIDFISVSAGTIVASYASLPLGAAIVFVNKTSGAPFGSGFTAAGDGRATIPAPVGMPSGDYFLRAQDSTGGYLARSVDFYFDFGDAA